MGEGIACASADTRDRQIIWDRAVTNGTGLPAEPHAEASRRRVLLCAAEFPPLGGGGVLRVAKLSKYLPAFGWQVTVACSDEPLAAAVDQSLLDDIPEAVRIIRIHPPLGRLAARATAGAKTRLETGSPVFRMLVRVRAGIRAAAAVPDRWLPWALTLARSSAVDLGHPDVIVTSGPPHSVHLAGAMLASRLDVPFVIDLRDEWSLRPLMRSRLPWRRLIDKRAETWCLQRAVQVVVVSDTSARRYAAAYPWLAGRLTVIPNGFDPADLPHLDRVRKNASPGDALTFGYAGTFQLGLDLGSLFKGLAEALSRERTSGRPARFVMLGAFRPEEIDLARRSIPDGALTIEPFLPHREALALMDTWDALLVVADDGESSLAGKIYEYLALRKPILVIAPDGPATRLVASAGAGLSAPPHEADAIARAIHQVLGMASGRSFKGASDEILASFDRRCQAETWSELLGRLTVRRRTRAAEGGPGS